MLRNFIILATLCATAQAWAEPAAVAQAYRARSLSSLVQLAVRGGELRSSLISGDRAAVLGALGALPHARAPWTYLDELAAISEGPSRSLALAATRRALELAVTMTALERYEREISLAALLAARDRFAAIAVREDRWMDLRVVALSASVSFGRSAQRALDLRPFLRTRDARLRRSAVELLPHPLGNLSHELVELIATDASPTVAASAAQVLCQSGERDLLSEVSYARMSDLISEESIELRTRVDAARCLIAADKSPQAVRAFRRKLPKHLSRVLKGAP